MMLSSVAERLFWMARYLERAENMARLVAAYSHLILDIPKGTEPGWEILVDTIDARSQFDQRYVNLNERNVIKFLLSDVGNLSSIRTSIRQARENMRTTRGVLPAQAWELVNECYLLVEDAAHKSGARQARFRFLDDIIARNQQLTGLIESSVMRGQVLWFIRLGQWLERADMTTRIVDVGTAAITERSQQAGSDIPLLWGSLLRSLSATSAYRRKIGPTQTAEQVIDFVFNNAQFPRSIRFCLRAMDKTCAKLHAPDSLSNSTRRIDRVLGQFRSTATSLNEVHALIDRLQLELGALSGGITSAWFAPSPDSGE